MTPTAGSHAARTPDTRPAATCLKPMRTRRLVVVAGSPQWTDPFPIAAALLHQQAIARSHGLPPVLMHADTPFQPSPDVGFASADAHADQLARALGWQVCRVPANPSGLCVPACPKGHRRVNNRPGAARDWCPDTDRHQATVMLASHPDVVLAFLTPDAGVARETAHLAKAMGVEVIALEAS